MKGDPMAENEQGAALPEGATVEQFEAPSEEEKTAFFLAIREKVALALQTVEPLKVPNAIEVRYMILGLAGVIAELAQAGGVSPIECAHRVVTMIALSASKPKGAPAASDDGTWA